MQKKTIAPISVPSQTIRATSDRSPTMTLCVSFGFGIRSMVRLAAARSTIPAMLESTRIDAFPARGLADS